MATFTEAFSSIGWAATAAVASVSLVLAIAPALIALLVVAGAWIMSPRTAAAVIGRLDGANPSVI